MKKIINLNEWINKNEKPIGLSILLIVGLIFIISKNEVLTYIPALFTLVWLLHLASKKLLGIEYKNKIKVFTPGRDLSIGRKLFLLFYAILALIVTVLMVNQIEYSFIYFTVFIIISILIGFTGLITWAWTSKDDFPEPYNIKKIIVLDDELVFYTKEKHIFKYSESRWKPKEHDRIVVYNKSDVAKNIIISLKKYKSATKKLILDNIESRIEKGLDTLY